MFNKALLGKWRWKFLTNRNDLCNKVIWAWYGNRDAHGTLSVTTRDFIWWRDLNKMCFERRDDGCWFDSGIRRKVGGGGIIRFWKDIWFGVTLIMNDFKKLFHLSVQKNHKVSKMGGRGEGLWVWSFN